MNHWMPSFKLLLIRNFQSLFRLFTVPYFAAVGFLSLVRLQAVPFWIVERSSEIAERSAIKTGGNERRGAWGDPVSSHLFLLAPVSLQCERTLSTDQKGTACSLESPTLRTAAILVCKGERNLGPPLTLSLGCARRLTIQDSARAAVRSKRTSLENPTE